jgi:type 1 glutamine amidotransferase
MKIIRAFSGIVFTFVLLAWLVASAADAAKAPPDKIRVLVVTGGHGFEKEPFFKLFKENSDVTFQAVEHPNAYASLKAEAARQWDVLVLYDMQATIPEEAKADFVARLKEGKGLVVLHHALCAYQHWPEYAKIIGGQYYLDKTVVDGVERPASSYKHDMDFKIHVADTNHPVTRGLKDFETHDETYFGFGVGGDCHPLLTTDEPTSGKVIAWSKTYEAARVVYIQSGHDHSGYENPNFQRLLKQAIRWTARRERSSE